VVKVNLTIRVPAEIRQFIEELGRRYKMGMGDIVAFVFNEFRSEIVKRLEERRAGSQKETPRRGGEEVSRDEILSRLMDMEAQPLTEEDYYLRLMSG